jgi:predicted enzyme related to lactoylglutathione lyase
VTTSRLAHVMIFVKDVPSMARFYEQAFELAPEPSSTPDFVLLGAPNRARIALHALPDAFAAHVRDANPPAFREEACLKACFEVADLDAQRRRILDCGGQAKEPWQWQGTRFCECADPEGNVLQIFERPA